MERRKLAPAQLAALAEYKLKTKGQRGGHRPGAGRPLNAKSKFSRRISEEAAKTGELPHEFALRIARAKVGDKISGHVLEWEDIRWAATFAAPFYAPRMSSVAWTGNAPKILHIDPVQLMKLSDAELDRLDAIFNGPGRSGADDSGGKAPTVSGDEYASTLRH